MVFRRSSNQCISDEQTTHRVGASREFFDPAEVSRSFTQCIFNCETVIVSFRGIGARG